ncbi:hypothetical protein TRFO_09553 [Tritrichomonas foetus]|uniref:Intimal thickness related receptor IRP domain-containing protein n=1 Tax=Tritrichomonas foetus TaxID=1144522 RepID=A0A1J4JDP1_9EUKA|nr:hypothetical protein TRFO_09553 [Tritrichomonas foetus]|eukprot:OHS97274.1 hypothetical protein TRFO_09553 [Tritrichomonas foetus]
MKNIMIYVIFLFFLGSSLKVNVELRKHKILLSLPKYGFVEGGEIVGEIISTNYNGVRIFALPESHLNKIKPNDISDPKNGFFCLPEHLYANISQFIFIPKMHFALPPILWNFTIEEKSIYTIYLVSCLNHSVFGRFYLSNGFTLLDSRNFYIPHIFIFFSIVYSIILVIWVINGLKYSSFQIKLHFCFIISIVLKCLSSYCYSYKWYYLSINENFPNSWNFLFSLFSIISSSFIWITNSMVVIGWCILSEELFFEDIFSFSSLILLFFSCLTVSESSYAGNFSVLLLMICIILILLFGELLNTYFLSISDYDDFIRQPVSVQYKLQKVIEFISTLFAFIVFFVLSFVFLSLFHIYLEVKIFLFEFYQLIICIFDMYFFLLSQSSTQSYEEKMREEEKLDFGIDEEYSEIYFLDDPYDPYFAVIKSNCPLKI